MYQNEYRGKQTTDSTETMFSIVPLGACTYRHMSDDDVFHLNVNRLEKGLVSREYPVFYASDDNNLDFIVQQINSSAEFRSFCAEQKKGGTRTRLYYKNLCEFQMLIPNTEEQEKIATFLLTLDTLITLHQRKLDKLHKYKKAMLQKMFPQNGADVPEIRFPGFTDAWEQRKLGEVGSCQSGIGFPDVEQGGKDGTPFFKVSDMNIVGNEYELLYSNNYVTQEQIERKKWKPITEVPAMFFAKVGAAVMLNRKRIVNTPFLLDNNTMAYKFGNGWDTDFGRTLFDTINLASLVQVGALPSYNASDVEGIVIALPTIEEQRKIGQYFQNLDHLITLHQRKCEMLQKYKKAMLQKMFV